MPDRPPVVYSGDLARVYVDPHTAPGILAYIPEQHASSNCDRALKRGTYMAADRHGVWCDLCVTANPAQATIHRTATGWSAAA